jgi:predicted MPP superfamily phosphohydrolase
MQHQFKKTLQIVSDVHLEFYNGNIIPIIKKFGDDLALLGDIGKPFSVQYRQFLHTQSLQFDTVFVLLGNHEFYDEHHDVQTIQNQARDVCKQFKNVFLLDRNAFLSTKNTYILGCTLWSAIDDHAAHGINDFRRIKVQSQTDLSTRPLSTRDYLEWHRRDVEWLHMAVEQCKSEGRHAVILTHHGPSLKMAGKYLGSTLNPAFVSNLDHLFVYPVIAFASGHVHSNVDTTINGIRSVSNAMGYPGEETMYKNNVLIQID